MKKTQQFSFMLLVVFMITAGSVVMGQEKDSVRYNQYGVAVDRTTLDVERRGGGLVFETKDQSARIWTDVRIQADGAVFFGEPLNPIGNGTSIRRARFGIKTYFLNHWYGEFDMDISNSELEVKDAYLEYNFKKYSENGGLQLRVGNFKEPFSLEMNTTSRYLTFIERANVVAIFAPSRHIGTMASYQKNWFVGYAGVHFQDIGGLEERTFSENNNKDSGMDEGYSFTGRMALMPFYKSTDFGIHLGAAASYRTPTTEQEIPGTIRYSTRSLTSINRKKYIDSDDIADIDHAFLTGLEFAAYYKGLRLQGEYISNSVTIKNDGGTEKFSGFYVFGSWILFGGKHQYNTADGEFTQVGRGKDWGDIELAFRYDYLTLNSRMDGVMGGAGDGYTFGINYHANDNVKIMVNYSLLNHDRYANGRGKLFVGHDIDGNLTKNPETVVDDAGAAGNDYSFLAVRFEIDF